MHLATPGGIEVKEVIPQTVLALRGSDSVAREWLLIVQQRVHGTLPNTVNYNTKSMSRSSRARRMVGRTTKH